MESERKRQIAIACQGGGSHTAFTAGALQRILQEEQSDFEIVALSGTSGGAICALLACYGLLRERKDEAMRLLDSFWRANSATAYWDRILNDTVVWASRWRHVVPIPELSPYAYPDWAQQQLRTLLEKHVDFSTIRNRSQTFKPQLLVGAVDVLSGQFTVFRNQEVNAEAVLASAAIPTLFRGVPMDEGIYWDGLFSQNPPIRELARLAPDEIWVIQINPQTRQEEPTSLEDIRDRRNELAGNLSLEQEIFFIEKINEFIRKKLMSKSAYKHIEIRRISMLRDLDYTSKLDRDPAFVQAMMDYGMEQADHFLQHAAEWRGAA